MRRVLPTGRRRASRRPGPVCRSRSATRSLPSTTVSLRPGGCECIAPVTGSGRAGPICPAGPSRTLVQARRRPRGCRAGWRWAPWPRAGPSRRPAPTGGSAAEMPIPRRRRQRVPEQQRVTTATTARSTPIERRRPDPRRDRRRRSKSRCDGGCVPYPGASPPIGVSSTSTTPNAVGPAIRGTSWSRTLLLPSRPRPRCP